MFPWIIFWAPQYSLTIDSSHEVLLTQQMQKASASLQSLAASVDEQVRTATLRLSDLDAKIARVEALVAKP